MLLTHKKDELDGLSHLVGADQRLWRAVALQPNEPYFLVESSTRHSTGWLAQTSLLSSEYDLATFCAGAANDPNQRIEEITQLASETGRWQLSKIAEVWEGSEYQSGYTTIVLLNADREPVGSEAKGATVELTDKLYPA